MAKTYMEVANTHPCLSVGRCIPSFTVSHWVPHGTRLGSYCPVHPAAPQYSELSLLKLKNERYLVDGRMYTDRSKCAVVRYLLQPGHRSQREGEIPRC